MYRRRRFTKRRSARRTPEAAGVAAVTAAMKRRVYNLQKVQAMGNALDAASGIASSRTVNTFADRAIAKRAEMYGIGDYYGKTIGGTLGGLASRATGISGLGSIGSQLGDRAGDWVRSRMGGRGMYTGHGDYETNQLINDGGSSGALFGSMREVAFSHREYITDIFGPPGGQAFNVQTYSIQPGLAQTFPFLSQIAANFEEYEFVQLIFSYKSTTTDIGNSTTGQCGTVVLAANYNAAAAPFTDKGSMVEYFGSVTAKVTESARCGIECDPTKNAGPAILYTRSNPTIPSQDLKTYDLGTFQLGVANSPSAYANLPIGELWVDYTVHLRKPKLFSARGLDVDKDYFVTSSNSGTAYTPTNWFGSVGSQFVLSAQQNNIGCLILPGQVYGYSGTTSPINVLSSSGGCSVVIPSSYNGNLRITVLIYAPTGGIGVSGSSSLTPTYTGNVVPISDLYTNVPNPGSDINVVTLNYLVHVVDVFVKQATAISYNNSVYSGGLNTINFPPLGSGVITQASIQIEQYQALGGLKGLTTVTDRVTFVNNAGIVVIP